MRYKLVGAGLLVLVAAIGSAWTLIPAEKTDTDCSSCTARHTSLQRLQQARSAQVDLVPDVDEGVEEDTK